MKPHVIVEYFKKKVAKIHEKKDQANTMTDSFSVFYPVHYCLLTANKILIQFMRQITGTSEQGESSSRDGSAVRKGL